MRVSSLYLFLPLIVVLAGCSTSKDKLLPSNGSSIRDIWRKGGSDNELAVSRDQNGRRLDPVNYVSTAEQRSYTRTAENEVKNLFPQLPNPDLVIYVYPHLSSSGEPAPVPGYSTVIPFYGRVQYAMPGENTRGF